MQCIASSYHIISPKKPASKTSYHFKTGFKRTWLFNWSSLNWSIVWPDWKLQLGQHNRVHFNTDRNSFHDSNQQGAYESAGQVWPSWLKACNRRFLHLNVGSSSCVMSCNCYKLNTVNLSKIHIVNLVTSSKNNLLEMFYKFLYLHYIHNTTNLESQTSQYHGWRIYR